MQLTSSLEARSLPSAAPDDPRLRLTRAALTAWVHATYRFEARGLENVPARGGALIVCNHVSFVDGIFLGAALPRLPRFVMHQHHYDMPAFRPFFELHGVIPIAPQLLNRTRLIEAMKSIDSALHQGDLVAIFPEGDMTHDGELGPIRPGVERIVRRRPVPVVPLALRGLWGSFFSRDGGEPMQHRPRLRPRIPIELVAGAPIPPEEVSRARIARELEALRRDMR